jgi:heme/copper-type cytochrome/quinol oxidase subunit 3
MKKKALTLDVSSLPGYAFGPRTLMWWGTMGMILTEGPIFAMLIVAYFYLRGHSPDWPPGVSPPMLRWGVANTVVLLLSVLPNIWYKRAAEREDLKTVRIGMVIAVIFSIAFVVIRFFEFGALNCRYDTNAYGSIVWILLGFHTTHLITDLIDTSVLTTLMFTRPIEGKQFSDVSDKRRGGGNAARRRNPAPRD